MIIMVTWPFLPLHAVQGLKGDPSECLQCCRIFPKSYVEEMQRVFYEECWCTVALNLE